MKFYRIITLTTLSIMIAQYGLPLTEVNAEETIPGTTEPLKLTEDLIDPADITPTEAAPVPEAAPAPQTEEAEEEQPAEEEEAAVEVVSEENPATAEPDPDDTKVSANPLEATVQITKNETPSPSASNEAIQFTTSDVTGGVRIDGFAQDPGSSWNGELEIPAKIGTQNVVSIKDEAFSGKGTIKKVSFAEDSVLTSIGNGTFLKCSKLTNIDLSNCSQMTSIGDWTFDSCSELASVSFPKTLTGIGIGTFLNCSKLTSIDLSNCSKMTSIGDYTFFNCSELASIRFPTDLTGIGNYTFSKCSKLTNIDLSNCSKMTSIGNNTFGDCSELASVSFPKTLTGIGAGTFSSCSKLTNIDLSNFSQMTSIGNRTFSSCRELASVSFPKNLTGIGKDTFADCSALEKIITTEAGLTKLRELMTNGNAGIQDGVRFTYPTGRTITFTDNYEAQTKLLEDQFFTLASSKPTAIKYGLSGEEVPALPSIVTAWWQDSQKNKLTVTGEPELDAQFSDTNYTMGTEWTDISGITPEMLDLSGLLNTTYNGKEQGFKAEEVKFTDPNLSGISVPISDITYKKGTEVATPKNVGEYVVNLTLKNVDGSQTKVFEWKDFYKITAFTIESITFENKDKPFDDSNTANLTAKFTPFADDTTAIKITNAKYATKGIGDNQEITYTWELTDNDKGNYQLPESAPEITGNITNPEIDSDIQGKINDLVKKSAPRKVYDGNAEHSYKVEITSAFEKATRENRGMNQIFLEVTGEFSSKNTGKRVFTVTSWQVVDDLAKIDPVPAGLEATGEIKPKEISATITAAPRAYDGTNVAKFSDKDTLELAGLIDDEDLQVNPQFAGATYSQKDVGENLEISGITKEILADGENGLVKNYTLKADETTGKGAITPYTIPAGDITFSGRDKEFDKTKNSNLKASFDVLAKDDKTAIKISDAKYENAAVGNKKPIDYKWELTDNQAGNYELPEKPAVTGNIGKLQVDDATRGEIVNEIKKVNPEKVYDGDVKHEFDVEITNIIGTKEKVVVRVSGKFGVKNVGKRTFTAKSWWVREGSVTLGDMPEFTVTGGKITAKPVTVDYNVPAKKEYDGMRKITLSDVKTDDFVKGDKVDLKAKPMGTLDSKNVGKRSVTVTQENVYTGDDLKNYAIDFGEAQTSEVTPKAITIKDVKAIDRVAKAGDKTVELTGGKLDSAALISGDELKFVLGTGTIASDKVGKYDVTTDIKLDGKDKENYNLTQPTDVKVTITEAGGGTGSGSTSGTTGTKKSYPSSSAGSTSSTKKSYPATGTISSILPAGIGAGLIAIAAFFKKRNNKK